MSRHRPSSERAPRVHILLTIGFTSLAWFLLDLILFATQNVDPSSLSPKLPSLDVHPVRARRTLHRDVPVIRARDDDVDDDVDAVVVDHGDTHQLAHTVGDSLKLRRDEQLKKWREGISNRQNNKVDTGNQVGYLAKAGVEDVVQKGLEAVKPEVDEWQWAFKEGNVILDLGNPELKLKEAQFIVGKDDGLDMDAEARSHKYVGDFQTPIRNPATQRRKFGEVSGFRRNVGAEGGNIEDSRKKSADVSNSEGGLDDGTHGFVQVNAERLQVDGDKSVNSPLTISKSTEKILSAVTATSTAGTLKFIQVLDLDVTSFPRLPAGPGEGGFPVALSPDEQLKSKATWGKNQFSLYVSEKISMERSLRDMRHPECRSEKYPYDALPHTSVIICFNNEAWSTLIRSVHSVLNRSPLELIEEVILVDDFSTKDHLKQELDDYVAKLPKVWVLRMSKREGLINARLRAVEVAKGPVITFLDSHIECSKGWLEGLLERIRLNPRAVPSPIIDTISDVDFGYIPADADIRGGFSWTGLMFRWIPVPDYEEKRRISLTDAIRTPTMAGGLFSIRKDYFYELGTYDPGLQIWGGENIELSFKVWLCGGSLEIVPCSHVGHVFRSKQPYTFPGSDNISMFLKNSLRVATVWLDDYLEAFYLVNPHLRLVDVGNVTERLQMKKRLGCKHFRWYHENVFPELFVPSTRLQAKGQLVNTWTRLCMDSKGNGADAGVRPCHGMGGNQNFRLTQAKSLETFELCMGGSDVNHVQPIACTLPDQVRWMHTKGGILKNMKNGLCLTVGTDRLRLYLAQCEVQNSQQQWSFDEYV